MNGRRHSDLALFAKYIVFYEKNIADMFNFVRMPRKIEQKDEKWAISDQFSATVQFLNTIFFFVLNTIVQLFFNYFSIQYNNTTQFFVKNCIVLYVTQRSLGFYRYLKLIKIIIRGHVLAFDFDPLTIASIRLTCSFNSSFHSIFF